MRRKNTSEVEQKKEQAGAQLKNFNCMPFFFFELCRLFVERIHFFLGI